MYRNIMSMFQALAPPSFTDYKYRTSVTADIKMLGGGGVSFLYKIKLPKLNFKNVYDIILLRRAKRLLKLLVSKNPGPLLKIFEFSVSVYLKGKGLINNRK